MSNATRWLDFVRERVGKRPMPMAELFDFELLSAERGTVIARVVPAARHGNPFGVAHGGFASTVLDIALGLVSIGVLPDEATSVGTTDLSVRYIRSIKESVGAMYVDAHVLHSGRSLVVAEAQLRDGAGDLYACGQSTSLVLL